MKIGKMQYGALELATTCDVCNHPRRSGNHQRCSKVRQERYQAAQGRIEK